MPISQLKSEATQRLSAAPNRPDRLALLHAAVAVALSLLVSLANLFLTAQMADTGGLAGITTRTALGSVSMLLTLGCTVALPFWDFGFYRAALGFSRNEPVTFRHLLEGFRRFFPVLRLWLLRTLITVLVTFGCLQLSTILYMFTPWSDLTMHTAEMLLAQGPEAIDETAILQMMQTLYPLYVILAGMLLFVLLPILYRIRLADWAVADGEDRVLKAFAGSNYWMLHNRFQFFKIDLSFWWYYALQLLAAAISYGDLLLPVLGIRAGEGASLIFMTISGAVQIFVAWRFAPQVQTTYALAYRAFRAARDPKAGSAG